MLNRLLGIVYILLNKGTVTASELAERFEVSVRTIYRDIDTLSMAGIPVYTRKGKNGGISLTEQFVLNKMLVNKEEQLQILAALASLEAVGAQGEGEILNKLGAFFQVKAQNWVEIDFSDWSGGRKELYDLIKDAILNRKVLEFDYYGQYRAMTHRIAEPVQLLFKEYTWYVRAYCRERKAMRLFKVLRMKRVKETGEIFAERSLPGEDGQGKHAGSAQAQDAEVGQDAESGQDAEAGQEQGAGTGQKQKAADHYMQEPGQDKPAEAYPVCRLVLLIDKTEGYRVYDHYAEESIEQLSDGRFRVSVDYVMDDWVYGHILAYGPAAYVLEPEWVRQEVRKRIDRMQKRYRDELLKGEGE